MAKVQMGMHPESFTWRSYSWSKFFNGESIKTINELIETEYVGFEDKDLGAKSNGKAIKNISSVKHIPYGKIKHLISDFIEYVYQVANLDFGYQTFAPHDGMYLNFNTYEAGSKDEYPWHIDEARQATNSIKLTLLINLSTEPFTGGEFQIFPSDNVEDVPILLESGSAFMFKSHILHRVKPVTSGTRKTLTMFIYGPKFK